MEVCARNQFLLRDFITKKIVSFLEDLTALPDFTDSTFKIFSSVRKDGSQAAPEESLIKEIHGEKIVKEEFMEEFMEEFIDESSSNNQLQLRKWIFEQLERFCASIVNMSSFQNMKIRIAEKTLSGHLINHLLVSGPLFQKKQTPVKSVMSPAAKRKIEELTSPTAQMSRPSLVAPFYSPSILPTSSINPSCQRNLPRIMPKPASVRKPCDCKTAASEDKNAHSNQEITKVEAADDSTETIEINTADENDSNNPVVQSETERSSKLLDNDISGLLTSGKLLASMILPRRKLCDLCPSVRQGGKRTKLKCANCTKAVCGSHRQQLGTAVICHECVPPLT